MWSLLSNFFDSSEAQTPEKSPATVSKESGETKKQEPKEIQSDLNGRNHAVVDCPGATVAIMAGVTGPIARGGCQAIGRGEWGMTSLVYYSLDPPLKSSSDYKLSLYHAYLRDAILALAYFGKGNATLVIGAHRVNLCRTSRPNVSMAPRGVAYTLLGFSAGAHVDVVGGDSTDRFAWCEILCGTEMRDKLAEASKGKRRLTLDRPFFQTRLLSPMLDCAPQFAVFDPVCSHGILTVDFEKDLKEIYNAVDTLAFRPHQVPFSFITNASLRVHINETILEAVMAQTLAPLAYHDPVLDVCFLRIGPMHMGRYESAVFRKE
jgi:hypothetical protein